MKNVHDLLAKLAWDFSPEQLDHLFECFQVGFTGFFLQLSSLSQTCFSLRKMRENLICNAVKSYGSIIGELDTCFKETEGKAFGAHQAIG